jgi:hypothetical protein
MFETIWEIISSPFEEDSHFLRNARKRDGPFRNAGGKGRGFPALI